MSILSRFIELIFWPACPVCIRRTRRIKQLSNMRRFASITPWILNPSLNDLGKTISWNIVSTLLLFPKPVFGWYKKAWVSYWTVKNVWESRFWWRTNIHSLIPRFIIIIRAPTNWTLTKCSFLNSETGFSFRITIRHILNIHTSILI